MIFFISTKTKRKEHIQDIIRSIFAKYRILITFQHFAFKVQHLMGAIMYAGPRLAESPYSYLLDPVTIHLNLRTFQFLHLDFGKQCHFDYLCKFKFNTRSQKIIRLKGRSYCIYTHWIKFIIYSVNYGLTF